MRINLAYLKEMSAGNIDLANEMIDIFVTQVKEFADLLTEHFMNEEYEKLGKLAHKAKASIAIMGMEQLASDLKRLELLAIEGKETEQYPIIINTFKKETTEAVEELKEITNNIELYF